MSFQCVICDEIFVKARGFASHLQMKHGLKTQEYTIKHLYNGERPLCSECGDETRYVSFTFKKYCKKHANLGSAEGRNKFKPGDVPWNKGKTKETDERLQKYSEMYSGEGNPFYGKKHTQDSIQKMKSYALLTENEFNERVSTLEESFVVQTTYDDYFSRQKQKLELVCKKCNKGNFKTLMALERGSRCRYCFPIPKNSLQQEEIKDFLLENNIEFEYNTQKIINPKELDFYFPENNFAIEYNGLYWHTEEYLSKSAHRQKTDLCSEKNIQLFHVFSDEWKNKQEIIKSMLLHRLHKSPNKIYARRCIIKEVSVEERRNFFNKTHISGDTGARVCYGLYHDNLLVACLSLRVPMQNKNNKIEISRYACELNTNVVGGLSKLLKKAKKYSKDNGFSGIMTYVDMRFGVGKGYEETGFKFKRDTVLDYWYTDWKQRFSRTKFKAQPGKSEKQVAEDDGVYKIYGCGSKVYELEFNE